MIVEQYQKDPIAKGSVYCGICNSQIKNHGAIKQIGMNLSIVCMDCAEEFEDEEIELMGNIFMAFGGYYGKLKQSNEHSRQKLKEIVKGYIAKGRDLSKMENDLTVLHQIFLYGISLTQLTLETVLMS